MSSKTDNMVQDLIESIKRVGESKSSSYDAVATVKWVDGNTAWVHIEGGVEETPVALTINAIPGDVVRVRVSGGKAWITGSDTAPPTDDRLANVALVTANTAEESSKIALSNAERAIEAADVAEQAAALAKTSATEANTAANSALTQLSVVEDVVGTLNWISEHGSYVATTDTEVVAGKLYFTRSGDTYTLVTTPADDPQTAGYYELDSIDEAVSNYVSSHLALTNAGLWVVKDNSGYKILLANDGMKVYDASGALVSTFGESITFSASRPQKIGGTNAYVEWYDSDNDDIPDSLRIVGANIAIASGDSIDTAIQNAPKAEVTVYPTAVNWSAGTATLAVTLRVNGAIVTPSSYVWTKDTSTTSLGTAATLNVTDLDAVYNCAVTW